MLRSDEVVVISGPPGSGKSTMAALLAAESERGVHLESDWFYRSIRSDFVAPHLSDAHAQNTAVIDAATEAAACLAESGYRVLLDGGIDPWFLDRVARRLEARSLGVRYLVLRADVPTMLDRVARRDDTDDVSGAKVLADRYSALGDFERHVIGADEPVSVVFDRCRQALLDDALVVRRDRWVDDRWPVSVKGVLEWGGRVVVLRNRRNEWELPGGRLDAADSGPVEALRREMGEELNLDVEVGAAIDSWIYDVEGRRVLIVTYRCQAVEPSALAHSDEHTRVAALTMAELAIESIPAGYLRSIRSALEAGSG